MWIFYLWCSSIINESQNNVSYAVDASYVSFIVHFLCNLMQVLHFMQLCTLCEFTYLDLSKTINISFVVHFFCSSCISRILWTLKMIFHYMIRMQLLHLLHLMSLKNLVLNKTINISFVVHFLCSSCISCILWTLKMTFNCLLLQLLHLLHFMRLKNSVWI